MGYKLCMTEKPSVAADIAKVIGATKKCEGYYEGNGYRVTWCLGHLVQLCEPEDYDEKYKDRRNIDLLPIIPEKWNIKVIPEPAKKKQFNIIKKLINDPDCDYVIDCGDMGSQGHYLQWLVRVKAGCKKEVKRFTATSLTKESILHHMNNLEDINKYSGVVKGAYCMARTNWIYGISFSRLYSSLYKAGIQVGLVKSPTLYMITKRYMDNKNFKPSDYYNVECSFILPGATEKMMLQLTDEEGIIKFNDKKEAVDIISQISKYQNGIVTDVVTEEKQKQRPLLYDITALQKDGDVRYGYTPEQVLNIAQKLYEKHLTTYPRTDAGYITEDMVNYMEGRVNIIKTISAFEKAAEQVLQEGLNLDKNIVNDKKVEDHHAILITEEFCSEKYDTLSADEKNIINLIMERMLIAFNYPYKYEQTKVYVAVNNHMFVGSYNARLENGYKNILEKMGFKQKDAEDITVTVSKKDVLKIDVCQIISKTTKAPELFTYNTLLSAMSNIGKEVGNKQQKTALSKRGGIGTQATRAGILAELVKINYIEYLNKGKKRYLIPSEKGVQIVQIMNKELMSPEITADCEIMINQIEKYQMTEEEYMNIIIDNVNSYIDGVQEEYRSADSSMRSILKKEYIRQSIGTCPFCGKDIYETKQGFMCENIKEKTCSFYLFKENKYLNRKRGKDKPLTVKEAQALLGKGLKLKCISKEGKEYKINVTVKSEPVIVEGKKYVGFDECFVK